MLELSFSLLCRILYMYTRIYERTKSQCSFGNWNAWLTHSLSLSLSLSLFKLKNEGREWLPARDGKRRGTWLVEKQREVVQRKRVRRVRLISNFRDVNPLTNYWSFLSALLPVCAQNLYPYLLYFNFFIKKFPTRMHLFFIEIQLRQIVTKIQSWESHAHFIVL